MGTQVAVIHDNSGFSLENIQPSLRGASFIRGLALWHDEVGKFKGQPRNRLATLVIFRMTGKKVKIWGPVVIAGYSNKNGFENIPSSVVEGIVQENENFIKEIL